MNRCQTILQSIKTGLKAVLPPPPPPRGTIPLDWATPRLLPKVRSRFAYEAFGLKKDSQRPASKVLGGTLGQSLVVDFSEGELDVTPAHLAAWGLDFDRVMNVARTNLLSRGGEEKFQRSKHGFYQSTWADNLDGSRILLPGILKRLRLEGDPVVFLPRKDVLLVAGSEDPRGLCMALEGTLDLMAGGNGCPLRLQGFQWEAFEVEAQHPARALLAKVQSRRLQEDYGHQKALLDRLHQGEGRQITVAPLKVAATLAGGTATFTHWTREMVGGWLPEADHLGLTWSHDQGRKTLWIPWASVRRALEPCLEPLGLFPERHRIRAFPGLELLEHLTAWAVPAEEAWT